jgi:hypothetical protein
VHTDYAQQPPCTRQLLKRITSNTLKAQLKTPVNGPYQEIELIICLGVLQCFPGRWRPRAGQRPAATTGGGGDRRRSRAGAASDDANGGGQAWRRTEGSKSEGKGRRATR